MNKSKQVNFNQNKAFLETTVNDSKYKSSPLDLVCPGALKPFVG